MRFMLNIDSDNAAFDLPEAETARILRQLADELQAGWFSADAGEGQTLRDVNGNPVGRFDFMPA